MEEKEISILDINQLQQFAVSKVIPLNVEIEMLRQCNEKCMHCMLSEHQSPGLPLSLYEELFEDLKRSGTLFITLTGGEIFLRNDLLDIIRLARSRRFSLTLLTNATLVKKNDIKIFKKLGSINFDVSVYGATPSTHDRITGLKGSFQSTIENVKLLSQAGLPVRLKYPIMRINCEEIDLAKKLTSNIGASISFYTTITARDNGDAAIKKQSVTEGQLITYYEMRRVTIDYKEWKPDDLACPELSNSAFIDASGDVYLCSQIRISGGNIQRESFSSIWSSSGRLKTIRFIKKHDLIKCPACYYKSVCNRCPGLAYLEDGELYGCSSSAKREAIAKTIAIQYQLKSRD